ncbi:MAG: ATP-binding cassette domain-containing protein, partial [Methylobacteriaceae bacterium]|nr:ATP-binding cassette domain-containing protein [Methylobacteriaceae bacterium]
MRASLRLSNVSKVFALGEPGGGQMSLLDALRAGKREIAAREVRALENIDLAISEGERVGVIGPNGAGKTTLLSLMAGITQPTAGSIEVQGDVHAMLTIGAVLRDDLTGRENIYLDAAVHGRSKAEIDEVAARIIAFSELGDFIDRPVRT